MKKNYMADVAEFIKRIVVAKEEPKKVKQDIATSTKISDRSLLLRKQ
jgi:ribosomal protein L30E